MSILLIRHAESIANINHRSDCHASIELSESGKQQAQRLCEELPAIDHIIISKYLRTYQTAEPMLQKYELEAEIDPNIHEFSYLSERKCANTNLDERKEWVRAYWKRWIVIIGMLRMQNLLLISIHEYSNFISKLIA